MTLAAAIPVLRIASAEQAKAFYIDYLGCALDWERGGAGGEPWTAQVRRDGLLLRLSARPEDGAPGASVVVPAVGVVDLHAQLAGRPDGLYRPHGQQRPSLQALDRGVLAMTLTDPFGNRLQFVEGGDAGMRPAWTAAPAPRTRAEVRAEYLKARADGTLPQTGEA